MKLGGGKSRIVMMIVLIVLALLCVAGVAAFVKRPHGKKPVQKQVELGPTTAVELGEMIVNLADTDECRYAKTNIVLELTGKVGKENEEELKARLRDSANQVIGTKHLNDLLKPEGKLALKKEILKAANKGLSEGEENSSEPKSQVVKVYFSECVMQ